MILGNTFMLGAIKEFSKGAIPCVLAHMLIDSLAILMLVKSTFIPLVILVVIEVILSISATYFLKDKNMNA
jgi:CAAX amino terminal protease family protein